MFAVQTLVGFPSNMNTLIGRMELWRIVQLVAHGNLYAHNHTYSCQFVDDSYMDLVGTENPFGSYCHRVVVLVESNQQESVGMDYCKIVDMLEADYMLVG